MKVHIGYTDPNRLSIEPLSKANKLDIVDIPLELYIEWLEVDWALSLIEDKIEKLVGLGKET